MRKKILAIFLVVNAVQVTTAQQVLSLDSCRQMALRNNKQLGVARLNQEVALNTRKAARTKYLPKVSAMGGYEYMSKEISLLSKDQKNALNNLGGRLTSKMTGNVSSVLGEMAQQGLISAEQVQAIGQAMNQYGAAF